MGTPHHEGLYSKIKYQHLELDSGTNQQPLIGPQNRSNIALL